MKHRPIPAEYARLADALLPRLIPWRKLTIAVDGVDDSGKSSLARFLAWQLEMPAIETDFFLQSGTSTPVHNIAPVSYLVNARHRLNRPVIVEGVVVLRLLASIKVDADILIRVQCEGRTGNAHWQDAFAKYQTDYPRSVAPDYELHWKSDHAA
jgi:hypothetical protein